MTVDYKNTVFLPKTDFPMKASLAEREKVYLKRWGDMDLYRKIRDESEGKKKFVLHYGPPYANGHIHIGHALSELLKDILNKIKQMQGFDAPLVPGWDCHGLPIEWQIEKQYQAKGKNKDDVDPVEFRLECRTFAEEWVRIQKDEFKRLGIIADWDNPYSTMDFTSEADIVRELGKFLMNGTLYRGLKPVMWSVVEKTALAEAEVEYKDHASDAIYVTFSIVKTDIEGLKDTHAVIWTTTPWSIPGNRAIAYGPFDYVVVEIQAVDHPMNGKKLLLGSELLENVMKDIGVEGYRVIKTIPGSVLSHTVTRHPLFDLGYTFDVPFLLGDHVTTDAGTGLVHIAPSHGMEDFILSQRHGLLTPHTINQGGLYTDEVPHFEGIHVFKANPAVIEALERANCLVHKSKLIHSYPHSWRSKAPLIYRAAYQWFIDVKRLRTQAIEAIRETRFVPEQGRHRLETMVENRPDWCISRQRAWGTPLTLFLHKQTGEPLRDPAVHERVAQKIEREGADTWFTTSPEVFLGDVYNPDEFEQVFDVVDVWFDSGATNSFVLEKRKELAWPADVYLEGSDQHRGWFQSSLWHGVGTRGHAPYKEVVTHGFVLDGKGYKMSKSQGNVIAPEEIIKTYGADLLRLWVASIDYSEDVRIGQDILKQLEDLYRRFRNTLRYLLGALVGFEANEVVAYEELPDLEKYILHRLRELQDLMETTSNSYDFAGFYSALHTFCSSDLSAFYFDIRKDSLYCDSADSLVRRSVRTVMDIVFTSITRWLAPVLSFTAEEAYLYRYPDAEDSIHMHTFPHLPKDYSNQEIVKIYEKLRNYRKVMTGAIEIERAQKTIGSSLQAHMKVYVTPEVASLLSSVDLPELAIVSSVAISTNKAPDTAFILGEVPGIAVVVEKAEGGKCERCWKVLAEVTVDHPVCMRCNEVVHGNRS